VAGALHAAHRWLLLTPRQHRRIPSTRDPASPLRPKLNHRGERCTFEAILEDYELGEPALQRLGLIVRAADVEGQEHVAAEGPGLRALAEGFAAMELPDEDRLVHQFPVYDALYEYARRHGR